MIKFVLGRVRVLLLVTALAVVGMVAIAPTPARADAFGCTAYSSVETPWIPVPTGTLCFEINGSGSNIDYMRAYWRSPNLCNWRVDWKIYYQGRTWWQSKGTAHNHCDYVTNYRDRQSGWAPIGSQICAELYNVPRNVRIDRACHNITR